MGSTLFLILVRINHGGGGGWGGGGRGSDRIISNIHIDVHQANFLNHFWQELDINISNVIHDEYWTKSGQMRTYKRQQLNYLIKELDR